MTYTEKRLALLEHITDQHNATDITRIPNNYYEQIKTLLGESIAQAIAEERARVVGEIEKFRTKLEWAGIQTSPESDQRKEYIKLDKYLDDLLSSLDKPLTDNKEDNG